MCVTRSIFCLLCCTAIVTLASSKNRCLLSPPSETNCNKTQSSWFAFPSAKNKNIKECHERPTCDSSDYFSSKEDCENSCELKCINPEEDTPYRPNHIITSRLEGGRMKYNVFSECAIGYTMVGDGDRACQDDGSWSGQEPHCYEMLISVHNSSGRYNLASSNYLEVDEGGQLMLSCLVKGNHLPEFGISWKQVKDGNIVDLPKMHDLQTGTSKDGDYVYIQFHRVTSNTHERVYSCISHKYRSLSRSITLKVKPKDSRAPQISTFTKKVERTHLQLNCDAKGYPAPEMTLLKDGDTVNIMPINFRELSVFQKLINNPDITDVGRYVCQAENDYGVDKVYLTVTAAELGIVTEEASTVPLMAAADNTSHCNMCPRNKSLVVKTCNSSNTVVSAQVMDKNDSHHDVMYTIKQGHVIKGSNSIVNKIKITHEALACHCPTFDSESWYVFTGVIEEDVLVVTDKDTACPASKHHIHKLETRCRALV